MIPMRELLLLLKVGYSALILLALVCLKLDTEDGALPDIKQN